MRVVISTVRVPFVDGGAELLASELARAITAAGHQVETVAVPFKWYPPERIPEHVLACRLLDLSESAGTRIDRLIGLKFPAYLVPHPSKVLWLLHQHRGAYDLWDSEHGDLIHFPDGAVVRDAVRAADRRFLPEARALFAISRNVAARLERSTGLAARPLYHPPPGAEAIAGGEAEGYFFFPSRLWPPKRQALAVEAVARTELPVRLRFAGLADHPDYARRLDQLTRSLGVDGRIDWLGGVSESDKRALYAGCLGVVYPPLDEDYGYVTLEAMLAHKPVVTCSDSGGPLELVSDGETGLVTAPDPTAMARAMDRLWRDRELARELGERGRKRYDELEIGWPRVVEALLAPYPG